jgi:membrane protein
MSTDRAEHERRKVAAKQRRNPRNVRWRRFKYIIWKSWRFVTYDIWRITTQDVTGIYKWLISIAKALILSVRFFLSDRMQEKASALTFSTLLAIVPLLALILGVAKGFGIQDDIERTLIQALPGQTEAITYGFEFAANYLAHTKTSVIMGLGIVLLLWVIISLIGNIEVVFNQIWQQKRSRSTVRKFTDYLSIMIVVPIIIFVSSGLQLFLQTYVKEGYLDETVSHTVMMLLKAAPYVLSTLMFTGAYIIIPNTKVKVTNALVAGAIAGCAFQIFQMLYISGQIWVSKYNAIYGSFAALPLLLLWVQMSWIICLYGAELAYASQNIQNFDFEKDTANISRRYFDFLTVIVTAVIYSRFKKEQEVISTEEIAGYLRLPSKLTGKIVSRLEELDVIRETIDKGNRDHHFWTPGMDINKLSIGLLMDLMNNHGREDLKINYHKAFSHEWEALSRMHQAGISVGANTLLCDAVLPKEVKI